MIILNLAEVGEDKAFAQYCYAIVLAEESYISQFGRRTFEDVLSELHKSVEYAKRTEDMEILVTHSQLQLSRLYLGTTHTQLAVTYDHKRIEQSDQCLKALKVKLENDELDMRCQSLYFLNKCDHHRSCLETDTAKEAAEEALELATRASLPIEIEAARRRITCIMKLMSPCTTL